MAQTAYADSLYIAAYTLILLWLVLLTTIVLVNKRRQKLPFYYSPILGVRGRYRTTTPERVRVQSYMDSFQPSEKRTPFQIGPELRQQLPSEWRIPQQEGTPEQIVIHIEPDGNPTSEQRNIQRIIRHLKTMPNNSSQAAS